MSSERTLVRFQQYIYIEAIIKDVVFNVSQVIYNLKKIIRIKSECELSYFLYDLLKRMGFGEYVCVHRLMYRTCRAAIPEHAGTCAVNFLYFSIKKFRTSSSFIDLIKKYNSEY